VETDRREPGSLSIGKEKGKKPRLERRGFFVERWDIKTPNEFECPSLDGLAKHVLSSYSVAGPLAVSL
jgi:hypothetical protein